MIMKGLEPEKNFWKPGYCYFSTFPSGEYFNEIKQEIEKINKDWKNRKS